MTDGLITRVGKWVDNKWQSKATENELREACDLIHARIGNVESAVLKLDLSDLKTRMEKLELYSGMTRKVDPTKPPIAKSAFSM